MIPTAGSWLLCAEGTGVRGRRQAAGREAEISKGAVGPSRLESTAATPDTAPVATGRGLGNE